MSMVINGVNSQTFLCSNMKRVEDFYTGTLGLVVVKRTVHHLDEQLPMVTFGFPAAPGEVGRGQTISYIEWNPLFYMVPEDGFTDPESIQNSVRSPRVGDAKGRWGAGTNHHLALHVPNRNGLLQWKRRLTDLGVHVTGPYDRNYFHAIYVRDPDGAIIEFATSEPGFTHDEDVLGSGYRPQPQRNLIGGRDELIVAAESWPYPVPAITSDIALRGFHHITSISSNAERTEKFFVDVVGLQLIKKTDYLDEHGGTHFYYACDEDVSPGSVLTFFGLPGYKPGRLGTGLSHHFSLQVENDAALAEHRQRLLRSDVAVSEIQDAVYNKLYHFRDPDGHICAVTTPSAFDVDEDEGVLGRKLCLPERFEGDRVEIERRIAYRPAPTPELL
jgi:glyoxalase family protein